MNTKTSILEFLSPGTLNFRADARAVEVVSMTTFDELDGSKTHACLVRFEMADGTEQHKYLNFGERGRGIYWK